MIKPTISFPVFIVEKLDVAKEFYTNYLSFGLAFENDWYLHLVSESGIQVGFMLPDQPTQPKIFHKHFTGDGVIFSLEVADADIAYEEAKEKSLNIVKELTSEEWGQRHFCIEDPNGIYLDIVEAIVPTEEYLQGYAPE